MLIRTPLLCFISHKEVPKITNNRTKRIVTPTDAETINKCMFSHSVINGMEALKLQKWTQKH